MNSTQATDDRARSSPNATAPPGGAISPGHPAELGQVHGVLQQLIPQLVQEHDYAVARSVRERSVRLLMLFKKESSRRYS
jgi:hypothetical protein